MTPAAAGCAAWQTTNKIFNDELFGELHPHTFLSWHRVRTANWLATSGEVRRLRSRGLLLGVVRMPVPHCGHGLGCCAPRPLPRSWRPLSAPVPRPHPAPALPRHSSRPCSCCLAAPRPCSPPCIALLRAPVWLRLQDWAEYLKIKNSGTYNNQYMVVDLGRFKRGVEAQAGLLWVVEQAPGLVVAADMTSVLSMGYWPSFNVPFFPEVCGPSAGGWGSGGELRCHGECWQGLVCWAVVHDDAGACRDRHHNGQAVLGTPPLLASWPSYEDGYPLKRQGGCGALAVPRWRVLVSLHLPVAHSVV